MKIQNLNIEVIRAYTHVVKYYDEAGRNIGYTTARNAAQLLEAKAEKEWCGTPIKYIKIRRV